jgi:hypothetical protein
MCRAQEMFLAEVQKLRRHLRVTNMCRDARVHVEFASYRGNALWRLKFGRRTGIHDARTL